ncbi:MAG: carboxylesterase family protein [Clostridia bacterium]|nr:carboxylesterase family protein [Clostridia bacterium]
MKKGLKTAGFGIAAILSLLVMLVLFELNKNTVPGWILTLALFAGFLFLHAKIGGGRTGLKKLALWIGWIALFCTVFLLTWPPVKRVPAVTGKTGGCTDTRSIRDGDVRGVLTSDGAVEVYAGIPYAKPPVGSLRWRKPEDPEKWDGVLDAFTFAPMSMQPVHLPIYDSLAQIIGYHDYRVSLSDNYRAPVDEDSLYVNVWKPAGDVSGLPVLVYIHGGSLQTGQPWYADYSGEGLARQGLVVVNMGYRLGVFGYLAHEELAAESPDGTTGNYGLLDQIKALEWVRDNAAYFGGDPENVTLAGESAGAASVSALCTSPLAEGLFRRAILESSTVASAEPPHSFRLLDEAMESGRELLARHSCKTIEDLRACPAESLVDEAYSEHHIMLDGYVLRELPMESYLRGAHNEEAILHGYNLHESGAFLIFDKITLASFGDRVRGYFGDFSEEVSALYPVSTDEEADAAWREIWGAVFFDYPHYCLNRLAVRAGIPVYEYRFARENGRLGSWHSGEMIYFYGNIPDDSALYDARDRELSREMSAAFVNFAKTGDPNGGILTGWTENRSSEELMQFGDTTEMGTEEKTALYEILDRMSGWEG